jgi:hypothetical protein
VGLELARLRRQAGADHGLLDLLLQAHQLGIGFDPDPEGAQFAPIAEVSDAVQSKIETGALDLRQGIVHVRRRQVVHFAEKAQGEVQVLGLHPARAGQAVGEPGEAFADNFGQGQSHE